MSFFKRLFNIGAANANAALDKLEDPVKMTEQGIRDLKSDLDTSLKGLAEVKAIAIRTKRDFEKARSEAQEYEEKAVMLLKRAETGAVAPEEADRLASEALNRKEQALSRAQASKSMLSQQEGQVTQMEQNVQKLKSQITTWENEAKTLKARAKVSQASKKLNKTLANIDATSTISMLEKMKEKVEHDEALSESYGDMAQLNTSVDDEINKALGPASTASTDDRLAALKARLSSGSDSKAE